MLNRIGQSITLRLFQYNMKRMDSRQPRGDAMSLGSSVFGESSISVEWTMVTISVNLSLKVFVPVFCHCVFPCVILFCDISVLVLVWDLGLLTLFVGTLLFHVVL